MIWHFGPDLLDILHRNGISRDDKPRLADFADALFRRATPTTEDNTKRAITVVRGQQITVGFTRLACDEAAVWLMAKERKRK